MGTRLGTRAGGIANRARALDDRRMASFASPPAATFVAPDDDRAPLALAPLLLLVTATIALHVYCLTQYGWFRDELYYLTCANHPAAGYVDQPPLSIWLLGAWRALFGESLAAVRMLAVLAGAALVFATGGVARALGGGRFAQFFAALAVAVAPVILALSHFYSMNVFDALLWTLAMLAAIRVARRNADRDWALLGVIIGLGLLNKISVAWLIAGLLPMLAGISFRSPPRGRGVALTLGIALVMFAPHVVWQIANGWPTREFMRNAAGIKMAPVTPLEFLKGQVMQMHPVLLPLWVAGLVWCLRPRGDAASRLAASVYLVTVAILLLAGTSRASYLAAAYPPLLAAGAIALERSTARRRVLGSPAAAGPGGIAVRVATVVIVIAAAIPALPLALPVLPVEAYIPYAARLGLAPRTEERTEVGPLPQHYADMFGWPELANEVSRVYHDLPAAEQRRCVIFGQNYGEAGAICVLGKPLGLPPAISGHNAFWMWGPGPALVDPVVIVIGGDARDERRQFARVERAGTWTSRYAMPYERDLPIWVCRGIRVPLRELWPEVRRYI